MIHCYKLGGLNIVLDVFSGSVHAVDEIAFDMIQAFETEERSALIQRLADQYKDTEEATVDELNECYDQICLLKEQGKLFTTDSFAPMSTSLKEKTSGVVKALCLHIAHTCNLNCSYCFASQGKYQGERGLMSLEVGKRALDFLIENSKGRRNLEVDFFGGEQIGRAHV